MPAEQFYVLLPDDVTYHNDPERSLAAYAPACYFAFPNQNPRKFDPNNYLAMRLTPDMLPFARQIQISDHVKSCAARLAGMEPPKWADEENARRAAHTNSQSDRVRTVVPGREDRRFGTARDRAAGRPKPDDEISRRDVLKEFLAAELLFPRDDNLRAAAAGRRRSRQDGLPRRALTKCLASHQIEGVSKAFYPKWNPDAIIVADKMIRPGGRDVERYGEAVRAKSGMTGVLCPSVQASK